MSDAIKPENMISCYRCSTRVDIVIMPYKFNNEFVGLIFVCKACHKHIKGKKIRVFVEG